MAGGRTDPALEEDFMAGGESISRGREGRILKKGIVAL